MTIDRGSEVEFIEIAAPEAGRHGLQMVDFIANTDTAELSPARRWSTLIKTCNPRLFSLGNLLIVSAQN